MATQKQLCANRANARKSTGPKTEQGKNRSSRNALTHGAFAGPCTLLAEEQDTWNEVQEAVIDDLAPVGAMESHLAKGIAWTVWRQHRLRTKEEALMALVEARRRLGLLDERMRHRWWKASRERPSASETLATDEEIAQRDTMKKEVQGLEAMTGRPASEIEERFESYIAAETHLQRTLQAQLATYYAVKDRKGGKR